MSSASEKYARRQERLARDVKVGSVVPQLPYSSVDGGALTFRNPLTGDTQAIIGEQWDGTFGASAVGGTPPPSPTTPLVTPMPGGLALYWDGTFVDGQPTRMDFRRVTFHAVLDVDDFDPVNPSQIVGAITIATGGEIFASLPTVEHFIFAVAWTDSGKFSFESDVAFGTPQAIINQEQWQAHEDALAELNALDLPDLASSLSANQAALDVLSETTIPDLEAELALRETILGAQAKADAAQAAALTQAALDATSKATAAQSAAEAAAATYAAAQAASAQAAAVAAASGDATSKAAAAQAAAIAAAAGDAATKANTARDDAITAAATAATSAYGETKTLVAGWRATGQTSIDGGKIATDSVTALQIAAATITALEIAGRTITALEIKAGTITANEIKALTITANEIATDTITANQIATGAVTANELNAEVLRAGFVLAGSIKVGQATWDPVQGLIIPQPNGARIHLPADGVTPATIGGNAQLESATVKGNFNLLGSTNKVSGLLRLANGIVEPTLAPATYAAWPSIYSDQLDGSQFSHRIYTGMAPHPTDPNVIATVQNYGTALIRYVNRLTGAWVSQSPSLGSFTGEGLGFYSGHYYVYGNDQNRGGFWIFKIRASDWVKVAEVQVSTDTFRHWESRPNFTVDPNNGECFVVYVRRGTSYLNANRYNANLGFVANNVDFNDLGIVANIDGAYVGTSDDGVWTLYLAFEETRGVSAYPVGTLAYSPGRSFTSAASSQTRGLLYHTGIGRFISFARNGTIYTHSGYQVDQPITASYTWYDAVGTIRETRESPVASYTIPKRSWLVVETATPPDSGNTDPLQVDKANQVGIYVALGAATRKLQARPGVDGSGVSYRTAWIDTVATATASAPASNTFIGGTTSTGKIVSGAEAAGVPLLEIGGDGSIKANAITLRGQVTPRVQAGNATGNFANAATVTVTVTYPVAFAAAPLVVGNGVDANAYYTVFVQSSTATGCVLRLSTNNGGTSPFSFSVNWIAVGT